MNVGGIGAYGQIQKAVQLTTTPTGQGDSFAGLLGDALNSLADLQTQADTAATKLATGEPVELHEAVIAMEKTSIAFQLGLQVRNKLVEAYQEMMRMQV